MKNGGVLHVAEGATATFMGASEFRNNSIAVRSTPTSCGEGCQRIVYDTKKGAAVHNKVLRYLTYLAIVFRAQHPIKNLPPDHEEVPGGRCFVRHEEDVVLHVCLSAQRVGLAYVMKALLFRRCWFGDVLRPWWGVFFRPTM